MLESDNMDFPHVPLESLNFSFGMLAGRFVCSVVEGQVL